MRSLLAGFKTRRQALSMADAIFTKLTLYKSGAVAQPGGGLSGAFVKSMNYTKTHFRNKL